MKKLSTLLCAAITMACISLVFTSCKDDDEPETRKPEINTVTFDGVSHLILSAGIDKDELDDGNYQIVLYISEEKTKGVRLDASALHHDGKTTDLTQKEPKHDGWYWSVEFYYPEKIIDTYGKPGTPYPVFQTGTFYIKRTGFGAEFEIRLKDGKVKGKEGFGDGKEHTISINFKGMLDLDDY